MELSLSLRKLIQSNVRLIGNQQLFHLVNQSFKLLRKIQVHFGDCVDALVHMQNIVS